MRRILPVALLLLGLSGIFAPPPAAGSEPTPVRNAGFDAVVVRVQDGDSLLVRRLGQTRSERLRISGIDAPERQQAYGDASRAALAALVEGERVWVVPAKKDRYGRLVALVELDERDIGLAMIEGGHAWYFRRYRRDLPVGLRQPYERAESRARDAGIGLWRDAAAQAPWRYRSSRRDDQRRDTGVRERLNPS